MAMAEELVFSAKPSATAHFPGGITLERCYDRLQVASVAAEVPTMVVAVPGVTELPGWRIECKPAEAVIQTEHIFTVTVSGTVVVRSRMAGDEMRLPGGTKSLKKILIDRKIPMSQRAQLPVLVDEHGVLGVCGIGVNRSKIVEKLPAMQFIFTKI